MIGARPSQHWYYDWLIRLGFRQQHVFFCVLLPVLLCASCAPMPTPQSVEAHWQSSEGALLDRHGEVLQVTRLDPHRRSLHWLPLSRISPTLRDAVIQAEDRHFYSHGGIDWSAMVAAVVDTASGDTRGGSTLTMQLAGLLDPDLQARNGHRSLWQKVQQLLAAKRLEATWRKAQILEAYLNLAPFRAEIVGIDAASQLLVGKAAASLDQRDGLLLAALLRSPNAAPAVVARRVCALAPNQACPALQAYVVATLASPVRTLNGPADAPELVSLLRAGQGATRQTTLDAPLQRAVRQILRDQLAQLAGRNVRDAAAVVIDNPSGDVLAWVGTPGAGGSARFVDGVLAPRQAGSTLKPFLYSLAIERQLLTAASLIDDSPVSLATPAGQYVPQNYDHSFRGPVSVRAALAASLNIPAVRTLLLVGLDDFYARLNDLGLTLPLPAAHYGYGLALGSAEVRLIDLTNAYRALANQGRLRPWQLHPTHPDAGKLIIHPAASWITTNILSDRSARATAFGLDNALATPYWSAAKTGTSKDMRDNWAMGFSARYTVGVWVGNADGESMWDVSGVTGAAPAWRAIMLRLADTTPIAAMPASITPSPLRYRPPIEPPRLEYFMAGTAQQVVELAASRVGPSITYPADGVVIALDPDIPDDKQRVWFRATSARGLLWQLDGKVLGSAEADHDWPPAAGRHQLTLVTPLGQQKALVNFQVRGALRR